MSWAVYLSASAALLLFLTPALSGISSSSRLAAAERTLDGVRGVFNALRPGVSATLSYGAVGTAGEIILKGHYVIYVLGNDTTIRRCYWQLPNLTIVPGETYLVRLENGSVEVAPLG